MQISSLFFMLGSLIAILPETFSGFLAGRILQGIGVGCVSVIAPMYLAEISPSDKRGAYVTCNQLFLVIGILVAYGFNFLWAKEGSWQKMIGFGFVPALLQFVFLFFIPETQKSVNTSSLRQLFNPIFRRILVVGVLLSLFQQITGINVVIYFAPKIFQEAGYAAAETALLATLGIGVVNLIASFLALKLIDKVGRRPLLIWGVAGMIVSLILMAWALHTESSFVGTVAAVCLMAYVGFFAIGMGPIPWLILSEIYPQEIKGSAMSLAVFFNWVSNYVVAFSFLHLASLMTFAGVFFLYATISLVALIFIWKMVPETKGLSLSKAQEF